RELTDSFHVNVLFSSSTPFLFFFHGPVAHRDLHSFPTRRSSDLSTIHEMLKSFLSLIASLGSLMFTALNVFGIDFLKYNHKTRILAINENILGIIILLKYSINPISK